MSTKSIPLSHTPSPPLPALDSMSTWQIAKLVSKPHSEVVADLEAAAGECGIDLSPFEQRSFDECGRAFSVYHLDRKTTLLLVGGYSPALMYRIINRMGALTAQSAAQPATPPDASRLIFEALDRAGVDTLSAASMEAVAHIFSTTPAAIDALVQGRRAADRS